MSLSKLIDEQIRNAIEAGQFDNLEGTGKPLDLNAYFSAPEDLRMGYSVLKSNKFVPEEVDRLKEINTLKEKLATLTDEKEKGNLLKTLRERELGFALLMERNKMRRTQNW